MKRSIPCYQPVITFLSSSPTAARKAAEKLSVWTNFEPSSHNTPRVEAVVQPLKYVFASRFLSLDWVETALECPQTGTVIQWLAVEPKRSSNESSPHSHALLAVQDVDSAKAAVEAIAERVQQTASVPYLSMRHLVGKSISVHHLLGTNLPLLRFLNGDASTTTTTAASTNTHTLPSGCLKEVAIPAYDDETDASNVTLTGMFAQSLLHRPVTGLYRLPNAALCLRPLPAAKEDRLLPPPSLVFHTESVQDIQERAAATSAGDDRAVAGKIGYTGHGVGQVMVQTADWAGMDVRFCQSARLSSMFAEAQDSLLAGSLAELQSPSVLHRGGSGGDDQKNGNDSTFATTSPKPNEGDCWVEFRANLKNPAGFLQQRSKQPKIAKAPDLPYE